MEYAQKTFISSTFWSERIGPTAALKTLEIMEREKSWEQISSKGKTIRKGWKDISIRNKVPIKILGIPALSTFTFNHKDSIKFKTFLTQEFLNSSILASNGFYTSTAHTDSIISKYLEIYEGILYKIKKCIDEKESIDRLLNGPVAHSGFERLN